MATTITFYPTSRTPDSIIFRLHNDGVVDVAPIVLLKADLLAELASGPLFELINRTADLTALNFDGDAAKADYIRINYMGGGLNASMIPPLDRVECIFVATGLSYAIWTNGAVSDMLLEMRALHSNER